MESFPAVTHLINTAFLKSVNMLIGVTSCLERVCYTSVYLKSVTKLGINELSEVASISELFTTEVSVASASPETYSTYSLTKSLYPKIPQI